MAFKAQRDGMCIKCQKEIKGGVDYITWRRTGMPSSQGKGEYWHYPACSLAAINTPAIETRRPIPIERKENEMPKTPVAIGEDPITSALDALREALAAREETPVIDDEKVRSIVNVLFKDHRKEIDANAQRLARDYVEGRLEAFRPALDKEGIEQVVRDAIDARAPKILVIEKDERTYTQFALAHDELPTLIKLINTRNASGHRLNIYMHGPAGSGKSTAARQTAEALGLRFGYTSLNPMTPDSRTLGFMHAGGHYVETEFFKCYTQGGVFCFDEIDNASASFVTTLNSVLENGHGAFPHGVFKRHEDFVCVCTANTIGRGGDIHYPERRALDSAFLERFIFLEWAYDQTLTRTIVAGIVGDKTEELMTWVDDKSADYKARFPELVISPRAYIQSALLQAQGFSKKLIESAAIARGLK